MSGLIDLWGGLGGPVTGGLGCIPSSIELVPGPTQADPPEAVEILVANFNPTFVGLNWTALITAIATGDTTNFNNAQYAFDQLFLSTASSPYLITLASDYGIQYPTNIGMPDDLFREYAISTSVDQLTLNALEEIQEVFYGDIATRASVLSVNPEPYNIYGGYNLNLTFDGQQTIFVNFQNTDFLTNGVALAEEVAFAITRACLINNSNAFAVSEYNPLTGKNYVRIYSGALGFAGSVQVTGGRIQDYLLFPTQLTNTTNNLGGLGTPWTITRSTLVGGNARYTFTGTLGGSTDPQIWKARVGDYVNIFSPVGHSSLFNVNNLGSFTITAIGVNFFEVVNPNVVPQTTSDTVNNPTYVNFNRATKQTIQTEFRFAAVSQNGTSESLDVIMPATSNAVIREPPFAAYLQVPAQVEVTDIVRDFNGYMEVTTSTDHNLSVGNQIFLDNVIPVPFTQEQLGPTTPTSYTNNGITGVNEIALQDGRVLVFGGYATIGGDNCPDLALVFYPQNRNIQSGLIATNYLSFTVQPNGNIILTVTQGGGPTVPFWNAIPFPGDTINIPSTSILAGAGNVNQGWYSVIFANSTTITMSPIYTVGTPVTITNASVGATDDVDCYVANDPMTNASWETMTALPSPYLDSNIYQGISVLLNNGQVLVAGGYTGTTNYTTTRLSSAFLYNPANDTWSSTGSLNSARAGSAFTILNDGTVLVYGGASATDSTSEYYVATTGLWNSGPTLSGSNPPVSGMALTPFPVNTPFQAILSGGTDHLGNILNTLYWYGFSSGHPSWITYNTSDSGVVSLRVPRTGHTATSFIDQDVAVFNKTGSINSAVLFFGGTTTGSISANTAEVLPGFLSGVQTQSYLVPTPVSFNFDGNTAITLNNGNILISGVGINNQQQLIFFTKSKIFGITENLIVPRSEQSVAKLLDGSVLFIGTDYGTAAITDFTYSFAFTFGGNSAQLTNEEFTENYSPNVSGGGFNTIYSVEAILSPTIFSISTPTKPFRTKATVGTITLSTSFYEADAPGPYIYDTAIPFTTNNNDAILDTRFVNSSVPISSIYTTTAQQLNQGQNYSIISVTNATNFPDASGYLVFNYGNDSQVIYVPYLGRPSATTLQLDYRFTFPNTVALGVDVTLSISSSIGSPSIKGPWVPPNVVNENTFYLTDSPAGRAAAQSAIANAAAGGILLNNIVIYPGSFGLGNWQYPVIGVPKINDVVGIYAENVDVEVEEAREGI